MSVTSSTSSTSNSSSATSSATSTTTATNPLSNLKSQDFLKLLLTELQYQDPTSPMDTDKMISQTSQLATLEAQNNLKTAMEAITSAFQTTNQLGAASIVGKVVSTGSNNISVTGGNAVNFGLYFPDTASNIKVSIKDSNGKSVFSDTLSNSQTGYVPITWNATDNNGNAVANGTYSVTTTYTDASGVTRNSDISYLAQSIKFDNGKASVNLGSSYIALDKITEIF